MPQNASTSEWIACACGCEQRVKPGQRWYEPACKARAYRVRQREAHEDKLLEVQDEHSDALDRLFELRRELDALERAYSLLREEHRQCAPPASAVRPGEVWAWRLFLDAIGATYRDAATQYHPDRHRGDRQAEVKMSDLSAVYMEIVRFMRRHVAGV